MKNLSTDRRHFISGSVALGSMCFSWPNMTEAAEGALPPPPPLSAFANNANIEDAALSPDAKTIAFVHNKGDQRLLVIHDLVTKKNKFVPSGDIKVRSIFFASPEHLIITTSQSGFVTIFTGGIGEYYQYIVFDLKDQKFWTMFHNSDNYYPLVFGQTNAYQRDGKYYLTAKNVNKISYDWELHEFDLDSKKNKILDGNSEQTDWLLDQNGNLIARGITNDKAKTWELYLREGKKWKKILTEKYEIFSPGIQCLGEKGTDIIINYGEGPFKDEYVKINLDGSLGGIIPEGKNAISVLTHPVTKRFAGLSFNSEWIEYQYSQPTLKSINEAAGEFYADYRYRFYDFATDIRKTLVYYEGQGSAGTYALMDFSTGEESVIGHAFPDIPVPYIVDKQSFTFKAADGLELQAYVSYPPGRAHKNLPLIVLVHGGPAARDRNNYQWDVLALASRGYAVLQVNYRGSSGFGEAHMEAGHGQWGKKMQTDLSDGVRHLAKQGVINLGRVAIYGGSYGGYAALAGAAFDPDVYRCAISVAGVADLKNMLSTEKMEGGSSKASNVKYWQKQWGDVDLNSISPAKNIDKIKIPILLFHGENDSVVHVRQSRLMNEALKRAGKPVTYIEYDKEDHWQSIASARLEMITSIMEFLNKHNPA